VDEPSDENAPAGETVAQKQRRLFAGGSDTARIEYFSDAVIAIAMTLLVLDLQPPHLDRTAELWPALGAMWRQYFAYVLSFVVIALNWVFHHRRFRVIVRYDSTLIWLNLLFLLFIAAVPFPTSLLAEYAPHPAAITFYAGIVTLTTAFGAATWAYAHRRGLMSEVIDERTYRYILGANLVAPIVFGLSIPFVFLLDALHLDATWGMWFWALDWVGPMIYARVGGRRRVRDAT
jgi:uncharacterized membrane protein